jgi:hypothetical protein
MTYQGRTCSHGNQSSCPEDRLCQVRLGGEQWGSWETRTVVACDSLSGVDSWRAQVAPRYRRRNYETRVIRVGDAL